jgi:hypothetical protein
MPPSHPPPPPLIIPYKLSSTPYCLNITKVCQTPYRLLSNYSWCHMLGINVWIISHQSVSVFQHAGLLDLALAFYVNLLYLV